HHLARAAAGSRGLKCLDSETEDGAAYLNDVYWALHYAEQNRLAMVAAVAGLIRDQFGAEPGWQTLIHGHHNHVRQEQHFGESLWIHRKGAQSARTDEPGIIPGSMGTASFHVSGRGCAPSLCSSSHGAGRKLSRGQARQQISTRQLRRQMQSVWFDHRSAAALRDEAPGAYKDIHAVMRAQNSLIRIDRQLRPLLSYKGR
ncbi:MAG: RtcB family protein, partial [Planctomycetaceae bacterium]